MRITKVETGVYNIPTRHLMQDSIHQVSSFETVFSIVHSDEGWKALKRYQVG